jgi:hypothetical protein
MEAGMNPCIDYITSADRLGISLAAKRSSAIGYLRSVGKYIVDEGCAFKPTSAAKTDVRKTFARARLRNKVCSQEAA